MPAKRQTKLPNDNRRSDGIVTELRWQPACWRRRQPRLIVRSTQTGGEQIGSADGIPWQLGDRLLYFRSSWYEPRSVVLQGSRCIKQHFSALILNVQVKR